MQESLFYSDPTLAGARSAAAAANAMETAAGNTAGAMTGFMGMGMAGSMGGNNAANLFAVGQQQQAAAPVAPAAPERPSGFGGQILSMSNGSKQEVVLFHAKAFDDAAKAADELRNRRAVILNMENVDKALTRRVVDFLSGCVYALDGQVKKIAQSTYLFCPHSMDIVGDLEALQAEAESYV